MPQDLTPLVRPGAAIACQIAWEDRPTYTAVFDAGKLVEQLEQIELRHGLTPADRDDPGRHAYMHRLMLALIMDNRDPEMRDWVPVAGAAMLWCGLHHPGLGARNVARGAALLEFEGRAMLCMEIRVVGGQGGLWFEFHDVPIPREAMPVDAHREPGGPGPVDAFEDPPPAA